MNRMMRMMVMLAMGWAMAVVAGGVIGEAWGQGEAQERATRLREARIRERDQRQGAERPIAPINPQSGRREMGSQHIAQATLLPGNDVELMGVKMGLRVWSQSQAQVEPGREAVHDKRLIAFQQGDLAVAVDVERVRGTLYIKERALFVSQKGAGLVECATWIAPSDDYPTPGGPGGQVELLVSKVQSTRLGDLTISIQNDSAEPKLGKVMRERGLQWKDALELEPELIIEEAGESKPEEPSAEVVVSSGTRVLLKMPLMQDMVRTFGRFKFAIEDASLPESPIATAKINVEYQPDSTIRGAEAWMKGDPMAYGDTLKEILDAMSERFGFEYEFEPEMPAEFIRAVPKGTISSQIDGTVRDAVKSLFISDQRRGLLDREAKVVVMDVELLGEWVDDQHLVVKVLKPSVEEAEEYLRIKRDVEALVKRWDEMVKMEMVIYPLKTVSSQTALTMVEPELHTYYIDRLLGKIVRAKPGEDTKFAVRKKVESAVMDEKSNSLIVTATAETHAEIKALLEKLEGRIERAEGAGGAIRVEVAVIAGDSGTAALPMVPRGEYHPLDPVIKYGDSLYRFERSTRDGDIIGVLYRTSETSGTAEEIVIPGVTREQQFEVMMAAGGGDDLNIRYRLVDETKGARWLEGMGLSQKEIAGLGISRVDKTGRASMTVLAEPGEAGKARAVLGDYMVEVEYLASRGELVVARATLRSAGGAELFSNTIFLEPSRPFITGITTLQYSVALVMLRVE